MRKLLMSAAVLVAFTATAAAQDRTQDYRMYSAERMIERVADKIVRGRKVCEQAELALPKLSEKCIASVTSAYPILTTIREVAMRGDPIEWAKLIDIVHKFEAEIEAPLNRAERAEGTR